VKKVNWLFSLAFVVAPMVMGCNQPPASKPSTAPAAGNTIGVAECDDYLSKVEACIANHVPEDARAMQRQSMDQMRDRWRQAAENPTAKEPAWPQGAGRARRGPFLVRDLRMRVVI
jgi:hypothetical protein